MRAAHSAPLFTAVATDRGPQPMFRFLITILSTIALLVVWRPAVVHGQEADGRLLFGADSALADGQDTTTTTHVVRAGETLWGIAARYYGDGHQWPALARRNRISDTGPAPLKVGMSLIVPTSQSVRGAKAAVVAAAPADSTVPAVALAKAGEGTLPVPVAAGPTGSLAAQTSGKRNAVAAGARKRAPAAVPKVAVAVDTEAAQPDTTRANLQPQRGGEFMTARGGTRIGLTDPGAQAAARKSSEVETVFHRDLPDAAEAERRTRAVLRPNTPAPRQAEFEAAPFVVAEGDFAAGGTIWQRVGSPLSSERGDLQRAIKTDEVEVRAPVGRPYAVGQRLVAVTTGIVLDKSQRLVIPSGVLEVVRVEAGKPTLARVARQSGRIEQGQRLMPAVGLTAVWAAGIPLAQADVISTIRWADPQELQPTLSSFVLLAAGTAQGVKAGDEFGIYRSGTKDHPESDAIVARARVVRSETGGSAAVITKQYASDIRVGLTVRRIARAP